MNGTGDAQSALAVLARHIEREANGLIADVAQDHAVAARAATADVTTEDYIRGTAISVVLGALLDHLSWSAAAKMGCREAIAHFASENARGIAEVRRRRVRREGNHDER